MLKLLYPLPKEITIACSGGVDSMAVVDFLKRKHDITITYFNHGTEHSKKALDFVTRYCQANNFPMLYGQCSSEKDKKESKEEYWRRERYNFFKDLGPILTCHHLDDCVETYVWSALHGTPKVIPLTRNNVIRPFLTTPKSKFINWCENFNVEWCEDKSNDNTDFTRNYVRKYLLPHAYHVNPGLRTVVKKIVEKKL